MSVKKVCFSVAVAVAMALAAFYPATGEEPKLPFPPVPVSDDELPPRLKVSLEFVGEKEVDLRGTEQYFTRDGDGKRIGKVGPKMNAPLPVKIRFVKAQGKDLKLSSRDYAFALLNDKGEVVERELSIGFPFETDRKTGHPGEKMVRDIVVGNKPVTDDPQLTLWRGHEGVDRWLRVNPGRYTLVVSAHGQIATVSFKVLGD